MAKIPSQSCMDIHRVSLVLITTIHILTMIIKDEPWLQSYINFNHMYMYSCNYSHSHNYDYMHGCYHNEGHCSIIVTITAIEEITITTFDKR